jgi:Protein of unknown function (DUF2384)
MNRTLTKQVNIPQSKAEVSIDIIEAIQFLIESESLQTLKRIGEKLKTINNPPHISSDEEEIATLLGGRNYSAEEKRELHYLNLINSYKRRRELLSDTVTSSEIARLLGCQSRQTPLDRVKNHTLLAVKDNGQWRYPLWQLDPEGADGVIEGLPLVLSVLQVSNLAKVSWLTRPNPIFEGSTPLSILRQRQIERVVNEARGVGIA